MTNDSWTGHYLCSFPHVKCWAALFRCSSSQTMSLQRQGAGCAGLPSLCCRHCMCWTARLCEGALGFVSGLAVELEVWLPVKVSWLRICEKQPHAVSLSRVLSWIAVQSSFMRVTASVSANMQIYYQKAGKTTALRLVLIIASSKNGAPSNKRGIQNTFSLFLRPL